MSAATRRGARRELAAGFAAIAVCTAAASTRAQPEMKEQCVASSEEAQALRRAVKLRAARERLVTCAQVECPAVVRKDCIAWLAEVDAALPTVVLQATTESGAEIEAVKVTSDGELLTSHLDGMAIAVDPGEHVLRWESEGFQPLEQHVVVHEGEKSRQLSVHLVPLAPAPPPAACATPAPPSAAPSPAVVPPPAESPAASSASPGLPYGFWLSAGVSAAGLASFAVFGIEGRNAYSHLQNTCGRTTSCTQAQADEVHRDFAVADVSLAISLVAGGVATWVFLTQRSHGAPSVSASPLPGGAIVQTQREF